MAREELEACRDMAYPDIKGRRPEGMGISPAGRACESKDHLQGAQVYKAFPLASSRIEHIPQNQSTREVTEASELECFRPCSAKQKWKV
jgi:hypothetical protein